MATKKKTSGKKRSPSRRRSGLINSDLVLSAVKVTGSAMATAWLGNYAAQKFAFARTPAGQIATKAGIALAGGYALKKFGGSKLSRDFMIGALGVVASDVVGMVRGGGFGLSGYQAPRVVAYGQGLGMLPESSARLSLPPRAYGGGVSSGNRIEEFGTMN